MPQQVKIKESNHSLMCLGGRACKALPPYVRSPLSLFFILRKRSKSYFSFSNVNSLTYHVLTCYFWLHKVDGTSKRVVYWPHSTNVPIWKRIYTSQWLIGWPWKFLFLDIHPKKTTKLTLSQPRGTLCPRGTMPQLSQNALGFGLETFWNFRWANFQTKLYFSTTPRRTVVTIATSKVDACFENHLSASFVQKLNRTRRFFFWLYQWRVSGM